MKELCIGSNEAGQRLDKFLGKYMDQAPKSFLYKMLRKKNITLNGKKALGNEILSTGDTVKLFLSDETVSKFSRSRTQETYKPKSQDQGTKLDILYEDEHTIFINKPAGMLSQKAAPGDVSLVEHLIAYLLEIGKSIGIDKEKLMPGLWLSQHIVLAPSEPVFIELGGEECIHLGKGGYHMDIYLVPIE